jgi:hypothetical protein
VHIYVYAQETAALLPLMIHQAARDAITALAAQALVTSKTLVT